MLANNNIFDTIGCWMPANNIFDLTFLLLAVPAVVSLAAGTLLAFPAVLFLNIALYKTSPQLLAAAIFNPLHSPQPGLTTAAAGSRRVRVLTLNAFIRVVGVNHQHSDMKDARIERICKLLNDFDIVVLQEATAALSSRRNTIVRAAHEAGLVYSVLPPAPAILSRQMVDSGLVILSRFPITKQASITYNDFCSADQIMAKGALYAEVEVAGGTKMHVFNTHLQSFYSLDHVEAHRVQRLQLRQLNRFIEQQVGGAVSEVPVIVCGDFNIPRSKDCTPLQGSFDLTELIKADVALIEAMAPLKYLDSAPTMSILYHQQTGDELSTTHQMCPLCRAKYAESKDDNVTIDFEMAIDRFFVSQQVLQMKPTWTSVDKFAKTLCDPQASDHWGLVLQLTT